MIDLTASKQNKCPCGHNHGKIEPYESVLFRTIVDHSKMKQFHRFDKKTPDQIREELGLPLYLYKVGDIDKISGKVISSITYTYKVEEDDR